MRKASILTSAILGVACTTTAPQHPPRPVHPNSAAYIVIGECRRDAASCMLEQAASELDEAGDSFVCSQALLNMELDLPEAGAKCDGAKLGALEQAVRQDCIELVLEKNPRLKKVFDDLRNLLNAIKKKCGLSEA